MGHFVIQEKVVKYWGRQLIPCEGGVHRVHQKINRPPN